MAGVAVERRQGLLQTLRRGRERRRLLHVGEGGAQWRTLGGAERESRPACCDLVAQAAAFRSGIQLGQGRRFERARHSRLRLRPGEQADLADLHRVGALAAAQRWKRQPKHGVGVRVVDRESLRGESIGKRSDRARVEAREALAVERSFEQIGSGIAIRRIVGGGQLQLRDDQRRAWDGDDQAAAFLAEVEVLGFGSVVDGVARAFLRRTAVILRREAGRGGPEQQQVQLLRVLTQSGVVAGGATDPGEYIPTALDLGGVDGERGRRIGLHLLFAQQVNGNRACLVGRQAQRRHPTGRPGVQRIDEELGQRLRRRLPRKLTQRHRDARLLSRVGLHVVVDPRRVRIDLVLRRRFVGGMTGDATDRVIERFAALQKFGIGRHGTAFERTALGYEEMHQLIDRGRALVGRQSVQQVRHRRRGLDLLRRGEKRPQIIRRHTSADIAELRGLLDGQTRRRALRRMARCAAQLAEQQRAVVRCEADNDTVRRLGGTSDDGKHSEQENQCRNRRDSLHELRTPIRCCQDARLYGEPAGHLTLFVRREDCNDDSANLLF